MDMPCKDCISLSICKGKLLNLPECYKNNRRFIITGLFECDLFNDYDNYNRKQIALREGGKTHTNSYFKRIGKERDKVAEYILKYGD